MTIKPRILLEGLTFGEGPRWHEDKLWFSDFYTNQVMTVDMDGNSEIIVEVPGMPSGLGWLPDGHLLVVSMADRRLLRLDSDGLSEVADLSKLAPYYCNDMVVDKLGRAYIGHFGYDMYAGQQFAPASLIIVTPEGNASIAAEEMLFPNGSVITPDGRTLIVAETFGPRLTAFTIEPDGSLTGRRVWAQLGEPGRPGMSQAEVVRWFDESVFPDGICLDAENAIWVAVASRNEVIRVQEGGKITDRIELSNKAFACMLGGRDRHTLFVMTADSSQPDEAKTKRTGRVETLRVDVPGAGLP